MGACKPTVVQVAVCAAACRLVNIIGFVPPQDQSRWAQDDRMLAKERKRFAGVFKRFGHPYDADASLGYQVRCAHSVYVQHSRTRSVCLAAGKDAGHVLR